MSDYIRKYKFKPLESVASPSTDYTDHNTGKPLYGNDLVWTLNGKLVKGTDEQAQRDYALQYGNPRFETDLQPLTVIYDKDTKTTRAKIGDTFEDRYADLLKAPTANELGLSYNQQLPQQENNDIQDQAHFAKRQADREVRARSMTQFNKQEMNNLVNFTLNSAGLAAAVPGFMFAPVFTAGAVAGGMLGGSLFNDMMRYSTGKTWGEWVQDATNNYVSADNAEFLNIGSWLGAPIFGTTSSVVGKAVSLKLPNNFGSRVLWDLSNLPGESSVIGSIEKGNYATSKQAVSERYRQTMDILNEVKQQVRELQEARKAERASTLDGYEDAAHYDKVKAKIVDRATQKKDFDFKKDGEHSYGNKTIRIPLYEHSRSNIMYDYNENPFTIAHEWEHAHQWTEGYGMDRYSPKTRYYVPNETSPLYPILKVLNKNKDSWKKAATELDSDMVALKVVLGTDKPYFLMSEAEKKPFISNARSRHGVPKSIADQMLTELSKRGYF